MQENSAHISQNFRNENSLLTTIRFYQSKHKCVVKLIKARVQNKNVGIGRVFLINTGNAYK